MIFPSPIGGVPLAEWSLSETCHESSYSAPGPMPTLHAPVLLQPNSCVCICMHIYNIYIYTIRVYIYVCVYIHIADNICIQYMSSGHNYVLNLMPCTNLGRPLSVVGISVLPEVSQMGYRYRVVPYRSWRFRATSERLRRSKTKLVLH